MGCRWWHHPISKPRNDSSKTALTKQALKAALTNTTISSLQTGVRQLQMVIRKTNPYITLPKGTQTDLGGDILALLIFLVVLLWLNIVGLKRYRKV